MCFSDALFPQGPFVLHYIARQYIENYFSMNGTDKILEVNTTVEDLSRVTVSGQQQRSAWNLTLRKSDPVRLVDEWWEETFDAVVLANGHYSVPYVCISDVRPGINQLGLTVLQDTIGARACFIYCKIPQSRVTRQNISLTAYVLRKKGHSCRQLGVRSRYKYRIGIRRTTPCLSVQEKQG